MKSIVSGLTSSFRKWRVDSKRDRILKLYQKKDYQSIPTLFKNEKDYHEITIDEFPFLYYAVSDGNKAAIEAFLKDIKFKDTLQLDQTNPLKCNILTFSYLENKEDIVELFENQGFNPTQVNSEGQNLLHLAAIYKRKEAFMSGLKRKINHNLIDIYGNTPLHYGCRSGQLDIVKALIAGKADRIGNLIYLYPIHMAIQSNNMEIVQELKDDLWLKYPQFHPIHSAARVGACEIMKLLLSKEPTLLNIKDHKMLTPLHHAVATQSFNSLDYLLAQKEILVNSIDQFGNTPLHIAFMKDDIESASKLIDAKADPDIQNNDMLAPVDLGLDSSSPQMKSFLKSIVKKSKRLKQYGSRL